MSATYLDLQQDVIAHWEKEGIRYTETENVGFESPEPSHFETTIKNDFQKVLDNEDLCLFELGYDSIDQYKKAKEEEKASEKRLKLENTIRDLATAYNFPTDMNSLITYQIMYIEGEKNQLRIMLDI